MGTPNVIEVLEQCRISPPPGTVTGGSLPATFFELVFWRLPPVQRLFFYEFPYSTSRFLSSELPKLKQSLALTLQLFYPLAGYLTHPPSSLKPEIVYSEGDFVSLVVAVSGDDFYELVGNHARDVRRFHPLVPTLLVSGDKVAALAIQVTVFPDTGISIGTTLHHGVCDGSTYTHFMKVWASMSRFGKNVTVDFNEPLPSYDRSKIGDPEGLKNIFLNDLQELEDDCSLQAWDLTRHPNVVRATFVLSRANLSRLGSQASTECSPYALACGYVWSCLVRARGDSAKKKELFGFVTGCRNKLDPPIPDSYFGNCLGICCVEAERIDLVGSNGPAVASEAIMKVIKRTREAPFEGAQNWVRDVYSYASQKALTVAGSPKLGFYEIDFGWERPRKVEMVSIERTGALSLAESREEKGGIEVGLSLPSYEMEEFVCLFVKGLAVLP